MKHIKTYEEKYERKFKPGDIVKYKYSDSQPFKVLDYIKSMASYKVKDLSSEFMTFFKPSSIELFPPEELENYYLKKDAEKYNL
jgi:hypothetical protein